MKFRSKACLAVACGFVAVAASAGDVRYVSPDATGAEDEDFTEDHPGTLANAIAASVDRSSWADGDEIVLTAGSTKGVYDCSGFSQDEVNYSYFICNAKYLKIRGYSGNRDDVVLLGGGVEKNMRCFRFYTEAKISDLTIKNFGLAKTVLKTGGGGINAAVEADSYISAGAAVCVAKSNNTSISAGRIENCAFIDCVAGGGGATYCVTSISGALFRNCSCTYDSMHGGGGAVYQSACSDCTFDGCFVPVGLTKSRGGATLNSYNTNCLFTACSGYAAAVTATASKFDEAGSENVHCVFTNCTAVSGGNGICCSGKCTDCLFVDNEGETLAYGLTRNCRIDRCPFIRNTVTGVLVGGGNIYNSLIFSNATTSGSGGSGILGQGTYYNCTVVSNAIGLSTQFIVSNGSVGTYNCLFAGNTGGNDDLASKGPICNCTGDRPISEAKSPSREYEMDANAARGLRWGVDPSWGIPNVPVGIKARESIKGRGSNLMSDDTTTIWTASDIDYAGLPRLRDGSILDVGCFAYNPMGLLLLLR